ncbi:hypothetical protein [Simiduia agarivorans]|nr:hypothetical protein [Simiduia agarivorans]
MNYADVLVQSFQAHVMPTGELGRFCAAISEHFCIYSSEFCSLWTDTHIVEVVGWENRLSGVPHDRVDTDAMQELPSSAIKSSTAYLIWDQDAGLQVKFEGRLGSVPLSRCVPYWRHHMPVINNADLALLTSEALFIPIRLLMPSAIANRSMFEQRNLLNRIHDKLRRAVNAA